MSNVIVPAELTPEMRQAFDRWSGEDPDVIWHAVLRAAGAFGDGRDLLRARAAVTKATSADATLAAQEQPK